MQKMGFVPELHNKDLILHLAPSKWPYFYNGQFYIQLPQNDHAGSCLVNGNLRFNSATKIQEFQCHLKCPQISCQISVQRGGNFSFVLCHICQPHTCLGYPGSSQMPLGASDQATEQNIHSVIPEKLNLQERRYQGRIKLPKQWHLTQFEIP